MSLASHNTASSPVKQLRSINRFIERFFDKAPQPLLWVLAIFLGAEMRPDRVRAERSDFISIDWARYSTFFRRILEEYGVGAQIRIDKQIYTEANLDYLLSEWCTKRNIKSTHNFELSRNGTVLFSFHDGPANTFVVCSELPFLEWLRREGVISF